MNDFWVAVVLVDVAADGDLQVDQRVEAAALEPGVSAEKGVSTAFSHEPEVRVKWKV